MTTKTGRFTVDRYRKTRTMAKKGKKIRNSRKAKRAAKIAAKDFRSTARILRLKT